MLLRARRKHVRLGCSSDGFFVTLGDRSSAICYIAEASAGDDCCPDGGGVVGPAAARGPGRRPSRQVGDRFGFLAVARAGRRSCRGS
jgi:hypothetical protein